MRALALLSALVAIAALALALYALQRLSTAEQALRSLQPSTTEKGETEHHGELAVHMGRIQRYHQKWWGAGKAGNAELAAFYLHELEEEMETVADDGIVDEGIEVSAHMRAHGLPAVRELERLLKEEGVEAAHAGSDVLVNACNACHVSTGHAYVRVRLPSTVYYPDQDLEPIH